jgi:hypothetical protein
MVDKRSDRLGHKNGLTHREFIKFVLGGLAAAVDGLLFGELVCLGRFSYLAILGLEYLRYEKKSSEICPSS